MLEISDMTINHAKREKILDHLILKLKCPAYEWKRINKTLSVIESILKYGDHNCISTLTMKSTMNLNGCTTFSYAENGIDKGGTIRNKA